MVHMLSYRTAVAASVLVSISIINQVTNVHYITEESLNKNCCSNSKISAQFPNANHSNMNSNALSTHSTYSFAATILAQAAPQLHNDHIGIRSVTSTTSSSNDVEFFRSRHNLMAMTKSDAATYHMLGPFSFAACRAECGLNAKGQCKSSFYNRNKMVQPPPLSMTPETYARFTGNKMLELQDSTILELAGANACSPLEPVSNPETFCYYLGNRIYPTVAYPGDAAFKLYCTDYKQKGFAARRKYNHPSSFLGAEISDAYCYNNLDPEKNASTLCMSGADCIEFSVTERHANGLCENNCPNDRTDGGYAPDNFVRPAFNGASRNCSLDCDLVAANLYNTAPVPRSVSVRSSSDECDIDPETNQCIADFSIYEATELSYNLDDADSYIPLSKGSSKKDSEYKKVQNRSSGNISTSSYTVESSDTNTYPVRVSIVPKIPKNPNHSKLMMNVVEANKKIHSKVDDIIIKGRNMITTIDKNKTATLLSKQRKQESSIFKKYGYVLKSSFYDTDSVRVQIHEAVDAIAQSTLYTVLPLYIETCEGEHDTYYLTDVPPSGSVYEEILLNELATSYRFFNKKSASQENQDAARVHVKKLLVTSFDNSQKNCSRKPIGRKVAADITTLITSKSSHVAGSSTTATDANILHKMRGTEYSAEYLQARDAELSDEDAKISTANSKLNNVYEKLNHKGIRSWVTSIERESEIVDFNSKQLQSLSAVLDKDFRNIKNASSSAVSVRSADTGISIRAVATTMRVAGNIQLPASLGHTISLSSIYTDIPANLTP